MREYNLSKQSHADVPATAGPLGGAFDLPDAGSKLDVVHHLSSVVPSSACLAHDMGNLLQVISSALSLIDRSLVRAEPTCIQGLCQNARTALNRIAKLRGQILDLARIEQRFLQPVNPVSVIASLEGIIKLTLGPGIALNIDCSMEAPSVLCDAKELESAILNLVVNARDAMPLGGRLNLTLDHDGDPHHNACTTIRPSPRVILKVGDTGCGMSTEIVRRVFEPFFSTKPIGRGTGLGLPVVAEFVHRVGGSVEIESCPGEGTTVLLNLPGVDIDTL